MFSKGGVRAVGVDAIIAHAGTAKMTLYRNFPSKNDLIIDFLQRRERLRTREWLEAESLRWGATPREQLLAIFDVFGEWFARPDFEGRAFLATMIEVSDERDRFTRRRSGTWPPSGASSSGSRRRGRVSPIPTRSRGNGTSS